MARIATWENIGTEVNANSVSEVLEQAKLDYTVVKQPILTATGIVVPNMVATTKKDSDHVFGVVSSNYNVCQNQEAFEFIDAIDDVKIVRAGETNTGMVYMIGKLPEVTVLGDTFTPYIIVQNGHNGRYTVKATICPLRIVCQNQFAVSFKESPNTISIQHSKQYVAKLAEAEKLIKKTAHYMKNFNNTAEELAMLKVGNDTTVRNIINSFFTIAEDSTDRQVKSIEEKRIECFNAYKADDNANFTGTVWGMLNGFSDFMTHKDTRNTKNKDENRFMAVTFDPRLFTAFTNHVMSAVR